MRDRISKNTDSAGASHDCESTSPTFASSEAGTQGTMVHQDIEIQVGLLANGERNCPVLRQTRIHFQPEIRRVDSTTAGTFEVALETIVPLGLISSSTAEVEGGRRISRGHLGGEGPAGGLAPPSLNQLQLDMQLDALTCLFQTPKALLAAIKR